MSWITVIWSMMAASCVTLAGVHFLVWLRSRKSWTNLLFCSSALAAAGVAAFELTLMHTRTVAEFTIIWRWMHVPLWTLVVSMTWFIYLFLRAGRLWLVWLVCGLRTLALILNFVLTPNLNFRAITGLHQLQVAGESVSVPIGPTNPWTLVGVLSSLVFLIFVVDASIMAWRSGNRRRAFVIGGTTTVVTVIAAGRGALLILAGIPLPYVLSISFMAIIAAMAYELSRDLIRAAQVADQLRKSEAEFRSLFELSVVGKAQTDPATGRFIRVNQRFCEITGYTPEELREKTYRDLTHPDEVAFDAASLQTDLRGNGTSGEQEYRFVRKDGSLVWVSMEGSTIHDQYDRSLSMLAAIQDITARRLADEAHQNLAHAQRLAVVGELTAMIAHEVNQPLGAILSNADAAELLLESENPPLDEIREIIADIKKNDLRADQSIRGVRALLRKREMRMESLDLNETVADALQLVVGDTLRRRVQVRKEFDRNIPLVFGDRAHLQQVLLNLVFNAMDAMKDTPEPARYLMVRTKLDGQGSIEVAVTDCGCGIDPERLPHLFDSFFTTKEEGMGLGLSIARSIITAHQGHIWAEAQSSGGTTLHFTVPLPQTSEPENRVASFVQHAVAPT